MFQLIPLLKIVTPAKVLIIWRIVLIWIYLISMWYDLTFVGSKFDQKIEKLNLFMHGRNFLLTYWLGALFVIYQLAALADEYAEHNFTAGKLKTNLRYFKDYLFSVFVLPLSLYVPMTFWTIYHIDRELVYPRCIDEFSSPWLNHSMHTGILFWGTVEILISHKKNTDRKFAMLGLFLFSAAYISQIHLYKLVHGAFPYGVLDMLSNVQLSLLYCLSYCYGLVFYIIGEYINKKFWNENYQEKLKN